MRILNFGSLNIDHTYRLSHFPRPGETMEADDYQIYCGGKGLNQSVALGKTGSTVYHAGQIGTDGAILLDFLKKNNVNTDYIRMVDVMTGHAVIQVEAGGQNSIILYDGANKAITTDYVNAVLDTFSPGDVLVLQNEINQIPYIMSRAKEKGMLIFFNPAPFNEAVLSYPLDTVDYLVVNETEAMGLTHTATPEDAICSLQNSSPCHNVIVTLGSAGSCSIVNGVKTRCGCYQVKAVDTTAAGDTYMGYLISEIVQGASLHDSMMVAAKAAALAVSKFGAGVSVPTSREVAEANLTYID